MPARPFLPSRPASNLRLLRPEFLRQPGEPQVPGEQVPGEIAQTTEVILDWNEDMVGLEEPGTRMAQYR